MWLSKKSTKRGFIIETNLSVRASVSSQPGLLDLMCSLCIYLHIQKYCGDFIILQRNGKTFTKLDSLSLKQLIFHRIVHFVFFPCMLLKTVILKLNSDRRWKCSSRHPVDHPLLQTSMNGFDRCQSCKGISVLENQLACCLHWCPWSGLKVLVPFHILSQFSLD